MRSHPSKASARSLLASAMLVLASCSGVEGSIGVQGQPGLLRQIELKGRIDAGYGVYPPYTIEDPSTKRVSGFSVEIVEEIGRQLDVPVIWHRMNWNTMAADLKRGAFDIIADPIFQTIPRAREFSFSAPYAAFADGIAVVRRNDNRFRTFADLNRVGIVIAVGQGWASETIARNMLGKATIRPVQTATDLLQVFNEVTSSRADVALADAADAERYAKEHATEVRVLFLDSPAARVPAGFALRPGDVTGAEFLNASVRYLRSLGTLNTLADKYGIDRTAVQEP